MVARHSSTPASARVLARSSFVLNCAEFCIKYFSAIETRAGRIYTAEYMKKLQVTNSTRVYFQGPNAEETVQFTRNQLQLKQTISQNAYEHLELPDMAQTLETLWALSEDLRASKLAKRRPKLPKYALAGQRSALYSQKINSKRQKIADMINGSPKPNLTKIAKLCGASFELVRKVYSEVMYLGTQCEFQYPNTHSAEDIQELNASLDQIHQTFMATSDVKKRHPGFSKKFILRQLRSRNLRYCRLPTRPFKPKNGGPPRPPSAANIRYIISALTAMHTNPESEVFYLDEMKLPLNQTPRFHWAVKDQPDQRVCNTRTTEGLLSVIAVCSSQKFEAVRVVDGEVNSLEFVDFIEAFVSQLPAGKSYLILADNAGWHKSNLVKRSEAFRFILFNEEYQFRLNMIENCFSYVRSAYRRRQETLCKQQEAKSILEIFFDAHNERRFEGYFRNHVRNLILMANTYKDDEEPK